MADTSIFEGWGSEAMATTAGSRLTPQVDVSERTQATYCIGAKHLARYLLDGDWNVQDGYDRGFIQELLQRMLANAKRQGLEVEMPAPGTDVLEVQEETRVSRNQVYTEIALMVYGLGETQQKQLTPRFIASHLSKPAFRWALRLSYAPDETLAGTLMSRSHEQKVTSWDVNMRNYRLGDFGQFLVDQYLESMAPAE